MQLIRTRIQDSYVLCEVRSQRAQMLRKTINMSKNRRPQAQDSSPIHCQLLVMRLRQLLTKVGLLPLKDPARPEEPQVVRGSSRHRIPALVVLLVIAGLAGQPLATAPSKAKLFPPGEAPYQIPLRWCALKGSPAVTNAGRPLHG